VGPHALGNRSIVADPRRTDMKDILNARIKHREPFRPFAPSILQEDVGAYFDQSYPDPFMIKVYNVLPDKHAVIPAVTHVDGTGRLQTVERHVNERYWGLINAFKQETGVPVVLNTSFNENEPIVCTPEEAISCFVRTKMDALADHGVGAKRHWEFLGRERVSVGWVDTGKTSPAPAKRFSLEQIMIGPGAHWARGRWSRPRPGRGQQHDCRHRFSPAHPSGAGARFSRRGHASARLSTSAPIVIADDVFIGMQSLILKGVTIGRGSVVTRDMPPGVSFSMSRGGESDAGGEGTGEWSIVKGKWLSDDANGTV
jgi:hypothetical protein